MLKLSIITPGTAEKTFEATKVFLPGLVGSFEVLKGHAPLIAALGEGIVRWDGGEFNISSGVVEVRDNVVKVIAEE